ncbi:uncharacterized protein LOC142347484 isoform X2 [Convolutriloba macropyga]|uniref:uncharacterized protein LOC142347484 isoform X2 n=1 Tax=Convolutriloba macropyga TaxID=536237 RepID=UPI003F51DBBC
MFSSLKSKFRKTISSRKLSSIELENIDPKFQIAIFGTEDHGNCRLRNLILGNAFNNVQSSSLPGVSLTHGQLETEGQQIRNGFLPPVDGMVYVVDMACNVTEQLIKIRSLLEALQPPISECPKILVAVSLRKRSNFGQLKGFCKRFNFLKLLTIRNENEIGNDGIFKVAYFLMQNHSRTKSEAVMQSSSVPDSRGHYQQQWFETVGHESDSRADYNRAVHFGFGSPRVSQPPTLQRTEADVLRSEFAVV